MNIKKISSITFALATLSVANAHAYPGASNSCNTSFDGDLTFENKQLIVKSKKNQNILFEANGDVFVDGTKVKLSQSEQFLAKQYYNDVEASIPMVVDITVEALNITNMALSEVFTGLLGEDSKVPAMIDEKLSEAARSIQEHVYQNPDSLTFNSHQLENEFAYSDDFDQQIEDIKEEVMSSIMGELFISLGKAMMDGDSDFSSLEERMEALGKDIETKAEEMAAILEDKAQDLCEKIKNLDETENQLQSVDALRHLDMIEMNKKA